MIRSIETYSNRWVCVVRVVNDAGQEGWGQTAPFHADITAQCVHRHVAPHALGKDENDPTTLARNVIYGEYKFPGSYVCRALAGVDSALWDLRGKVQGKAVTELMGGKPRPFRVYASSMRRDITPVDEADRIRRNREEHGFVACKIKIGDRMGGDQDAWPGRTPDLIRTVRKVMGDDFTIFADANGAYTAKGAIALRDVLVENNVAMFEEPCPYWDIESTAEVRASMPMDVSGGEQDWDLAQWRRIVTMPAVDIVQPDVCYVGGPTRLLQVAEMARGKSIPCVPHSANRSMLLIFSLHLMSALPNAGDFVECGIEPSEWADIYEPGVEIRDGLCHYPAGPGWGVRVKTSWLEQAKREVSSK